ncbi:MAG: hypothetical protein M3069_01005 [Chloroflexota bacterium]|nr:hypothetical protein [Chloroflexota bacterium]
MDLGLWIVQLLLAVAFAFDGALKLVRPIGRLAGRMTFVTVMPAGVVRLIGVVRSELHQLGGSVALGILAVFVAYGRFVLVPFGN